MADVADLNPAFAPKLAALRDALTKAGINANVISGYRSPEYQQQLIDQGVHPAAQPWRSFHQYGLAADLQLANQADYPRMWSMAPQYGLHALGVWLVLSSHAGDLNQDIQQYHLANWRPASQPAPATGAIAYSGPSGQPSRVATTAPGTSINSSPMDIVLNAESGNRNVANTHATTSSGQAQGYPQITTGTWNDALNIWVKSYESPADTQGDVIKVASASQSTAGRPRPSTRSVKPTRDRHPPRPWLQARRSIAHRPQEPLRRPPAALRPLRPQDSRASPQPAWRAICRASRPIRRGPR